MLFAEVGNRLKMSQAGRSRMRREDRKTLARGLFHGSTSGFLSEYMRSPDVLVKQYKLLNETMKSLAFLFPKYVFFSIIL